ncbi:MAG: fructose bisphosphate aldolase [Streptosporangiaceae bacterium]
MKLAEITSPYPAAITAASRQFAGARPVLRWPLHSGAAKMAAMDGEQLEKVWSGRGFFAALDQSGGSTPKALAEYGIDESRYGSQEEMFDLVHAMRTRVITDPAFDGSRILGAILFEQTMDRDVNGEPTARYLWADKQVVPFLKVDKGLDAEQNAVQLMKPIDALDELLDRAGRHRIFGTKMRSVIHDADKDGVAAVAAQQFEYGARISAAGLVPILEPEVSIDSPRKDEAEALLQDELQAHIAALPDDRPIILKLTIPTQPGRYAGLAADPRVLRVLALSGGYSRNQACSLLARDQAMIASFSRALLEGLSDQQTGEQFHARLDASIGQIFDASARKVQPGS